ncbi:MAG: hypothetical protein ACLUDU_21080 [Butyricimonas faecihominis]
MNEVGLLYFSWFNVRKLNKYLSTNNHKAISYFDNHPVFTLEDSGTMMGIWLEDIFTWQRFCTYGHADVKGGLGWKGGSDIL